MRFFKLILNFLWKFHVNQNLIHQLPTLWSTERLETHVGDFSNYNHLIIYSFLLINKISITIKMYIESKVSVVKLDVQYDHRLLLPLFLIASAIVWLNYWWFFFSVYPMHLVLLLKTLECLHITVGSCRVPFSSCPKLHNQVDWGHKN